MMKAAPTTPTISTAVGAAQPIDEIGCSDHSDHSDQNYNGGSGTTKPLMSLVKKLRQSRKGVSTSVSRHVHPDPETILFSELHTPSSVGVVGVVGVPHDNNELEDFIGRSGSRSGRSRALDEPLRPGSRSPVDAWGLTTAEKAQALARLQIKTNPESEPDDIGHDRAEPDEWPRQSIPQAEMVAGLLRAAALPSPNRQSEPVASYVARSPIDPWEDGIFRLLDMPPLAEFTPARWRRLCLDCAELIEEWGTEMRRLGWSVEDAFGIHPISPGINVSLSGLGVVLNGGKVTAMTEIGATITRPNSVRQSFTRKPMNGAVPIWALSGDMRMTPHANG